MAVTDIDMGLPLAFLEKMRALLGEREYADFLESYGRERTPGLRLNPLKAIDEATILKLTEQLGLEKIPWALEGYYYDSQSAPGKHVWHEAGVYYIQEPSAMAAAELLAAEPGDKVLDLCGAPGGKTTQIAARLKGRGLLVANEIHPARAKILSQNVERMGISNAVVTNEEAETLARRFPSFFDKVMVDAPCSGEGMFRKDQEARGHWSPENVAMCARRQAGILDWAGAMVRPGGRLVYSTCTFSPEENEGSISGFLRRDPRFFLEEARVFEGFEGGRPQWVNGGQEELARAVRLWPHRVNGEGHFVAVLRKDGQAEHKDRRFKKPAYVRDRQVTDLWQGFCRQTLTKEGQQFGAWAQERLVLFGDQLYRIPDEMPDYGGLRILRPGLHLGTWKKNRFEPSHGLALHLKKEQVRRWVTWEAQSSQMEAYLRGETLNVPCPGGENGWVVMAAGDYSVGWAKQVGQVLKNHYPKGLRRG